MKQIIVLIGIALLCMGVGGCKQSNEPEATDGKIYLKDFPPETVTGLVNGSWKIFEQNGEGVDRDMYLRYDIGGEKVVDCRDSVRTTPIRAFARNDYGMAIETEASSVTVWIIYAEGDTLYGTSPEYPPRTSWKAKRITDADFESIRLNVQYPGYLSGIKCMPEAVPEETKGSIAGVWKLVKDVDRGIDYSCDNITYHFPSYGDSTLTVTSDREDYPSGVYDYSYLPEGACPTCLPIKANYILSIKGISVYNEVLEDMMFLRDDDVTYPLPATRFFVRIK